LANALEVTYSSSDLARLNRMMPLDRYSVPVRLSFSIFVCFMFFLGVGSKQNELDLVFAFMVNSSGRNFG